ncbi:MAG: hypothetical protein DI536_01820 [Archangium gephyra]|uniref:Uncharacterized protein n=1 Tax=Archangium gephyra TaxID=48 RepID=A0A2W5TW26_9BACT|nr:MAG: hypothetical protein DI536_01820 [Archangium gephyra]
MAKSTLAPMCSEIFWNARSHAACEYQPSGASCTRSSAPSEPMPCSTRNRLGMRRSKAKAATTDHTVWPFTSTSGANGTNCIS